MAQINAKLIKKEQFQATTVIDIDNLNTKYFCKQNELIKQSPSTTYSYSNLQLGNLTQVNTFNPLKLSLFYKPFNTVVILDNRLAEIYKIDFNQLTPYRDPEFITAGYDNTLWIFNSITQQLELYDYKNNTTRTTTTPINNPVLDLISNYNYCWLLTDTYIYKFNYMGSLVFKIKNEGFNKFVLANDDLILQKNNQLYFLKQDQTTAEDILIPDLTIKQFLVTNETLYIYSNETLYQFLLKTK
ncbi:hypothetical protein [Formosa sp. A9]|uniref:hypothetical protein n=1 Tax=Formosa sp. A9 TaxID=3442641 RepID=UPI003EB9B7AB